MLIANIIRELGETLPNPAQEPEGPEEPRQSIDDYPIPGLGSIKNDRARKTLNAHCRCLGRQDDPRYHTTRATPKCTFNRAANKAPLGLLLEWLRCQGACCDREAHLNARWIIHFDARKMSREWIVSQPSLKPLLEFERGHCGGDVVKEPFVMC